MIVVCFLYLTALSGIGMITIASVPEPPRWLWGLVWLGAALIVFNMFWSLR